jgi:hypothetical protein
VAICAGNRLGFAAFLGVVGFSSFAQAAKSVALAPAVQAVVDCRVLVADSQRLACFDKAVGAMTAAETSGDLVTIDREQRRAVRRQAFGLALPSLTLFDRGEKPEEVDRLAVTVSSAARNARGQWFIKLEDGALWRQTDDAEIYPAPKTGSKALIRKGALGSFFMSIDGQPSIRVHRDS